MQVCGEEWVAHVTCRRKLMDELTQPGNGGIHPTHDIFNAMVARQKRAIASSEGALLIDDLIEWLDERIDEVAEPGARCASAIPRRSASPRRWRSATSCPTPSRGRSTSSPSSSCARTTASAGTSSRARARRGAIKTDTRPTGRRPGVSLRGRPVGAVSPAPAAGRRAARRHPARALPQAPRALALGARPRRARRARRAHAAGPQRAGSRTGGRPDDHVVDRQLRLLHLQRLPPARRRQRRGAHRRPQRHGLLARAGALGLRRDRALARPGPAGPLARLRRLLRHPALQRDPGVRRLPRPPGPGLRAERDRRDRARGDARSPQPRAAQRDRALRRRSAGLLRRPLPLAGGHRSARSGGARDRVDRGRRGHGDRAHAPTAVGRAVPPRVDRLRARPRDRQELLRHGPRASARSPASAAPAARSRVRARHARPARLAALASNCTFARWTSSRRPSSLFQRLFGAAEYAFWLDSADAPTRLAQSSYLGTSTGAAGVPAALRHRGGPGHSYTRERGRPSRRTRSSTSSTASIAARQDRAARGHRRRADRRLRRLPRLRVQGRLRLAQRPSLRHPGRGDDVRQPRRRRRPRSSPHAPARV